LTDFIENWYKYIYGKDDDARQMEYQYKFNLKSYITVQSDYCPCSIYLI